jgi:hypothetical protein
MLTLFCVAVPVHDLNHGTNGGVVKVPGYGTNPCERTVRTESSGFHSPTRNLPIP